MVVVSWYGMSTSLPPRERGLKLQFGCGHLDHIVAPPAGAWIEIKASAAALGDWTVAPPAGAWIEIQGGPGEARIDVVAPPAGAWIEILRLHKNNSEKMSLPPRERGLKFQLTVWIH